EIGQQAVVAGVEGAPDIRWRVALQNLQAAGIGRGDPEDRLAMVAAVDHVLAAVDRDRSGKIADVGGEGEGRRHDFTGSIERGGHRVEMALDLSARQAGGSE